MALGGRSNYVLTLRAPLSLRTHELCLTSAVDFINLIHVASAIWPTHRNLLMTRTSLVYKVLSLRSSEVLRHTGLSFQEELLMFSSYQITQDASLSNNSVNMDQFSYAACCMLVYKAARRKHLTLLMLKTSPGWPEQTPIKQKRSCQ